MKRKPVNTFLVTIALLGLAGFALGGVTSSARTTRFVVEEDHVTITLHAGSYRVHNGEAGQRIEMDGFGELMIPGQPRLPMKRFPICLPPGAQARSVEVVSIQTTEVPGVYEIEPCPAIAFLPGTPRLGEAMQRMQREWQADYEAVYASDRPHPRKTAWLTARGTLRKYAYVSVAFCPFTYHPVTGRLDYHHEVDIRIMYDLPEAGSAESELVDRLLHDRVADEKAASLFSNYDEIVELYQVEELHTMPLTQPYDYVIITTSANESAITSSDFPTWKTALGHSLRTVLTTDSEIASQPGADLAEQIRNFLRAHYATWGIEYVLLVGNYATVPMRICYPDSAFHVYDPNDVGLVAPGTPNDHYYADLSFPDSVSWDSDGDGYPGEYRQDNPDFLAEVAVGRIPVNNLTRIIYALNKLVAFEQDTGAWKSNALIAGSILFFENQDYSGYPFIDGSTCLDSIETGLLSGMTITHMTEQAGLVTSPFPWPAISETAFNIAWRTGEHAVVNWSGHGWSDGAYRTVWEWDDGDGVPEHGNGEMQSHQFIHKTTSSLDDDHPSIVFAISCNVGYPEPNPYGRCGVDLLTLPGWGASAGIVSSSRPAAISGDWKNSPGGTEQICYEFNRYMIVEGEKIGDALYDGKYYATANYGWDRVYEYMNLYNFNLYGDPALEVGGATAGIVGGHGGVGELVFRLGPGQPNPFMSTTSLRFALSAPGRVRMVVHDIQGRQVATLADRQYGAGESTVTWDGTGESGQRMSPGLYFVTVEALGRKAASKVVLLK